MVADDGAQDDRQEQGAQGIGHEAYIGEAGPANRGQRALGRIEQP